MAIKPWALGCGLAWLALTPAPSFGAAEDLKLDLPIACSAARPCVVQNYVDTDPGPDAKDYRCGAQTYQGHNGVDIRAPDMAAQRQGVPVLAAADGVVLRLRSTAPDISIRAAGAPSVAGQECGNGLVIGHRDGWETQYCHMARGSLVVKVGQSVKAGDVLGRVGLSGMTEFPHLHLTVRQRGQMVDPFGPGVAPGACTPISGRTLWSAKALQTLGYQAGSVLNFGFSSTEASMETIEQAQLPRPSAEQPFLFSYVRSIHLEKGDVQILSVTGPDGKVLSTAKMAPLDRDKAQVFVYAGLRRPATGWVRGQYRASYRVIRAGGEVLAKSFSTQL